MKMSKLKGLLGMLGQAEQVWIERSQPRLCRFQQIPDQPVPWCSLAVIPNSIAELTNQSLDAA